MNIILLTILLTLLGAGLVVLLVWLGVVSRRLIKASRSNKKGLVGLEESVVINMNDIYRVMEEYKTEVSQNFSSVYDEQERVLTDRDQKFEKLEASIDSRFDKIYHTLQSMSTEKKG